jgi:TonB C terminal
MVPEAPPETEPPKTESKSELEERRRVEHAEHTRDEADKKKQQPDKDKTPKKQKEEKADANPPKPEAKDEAKPAEKKPEPQKPEPPAEVIEIPRRVAVKQVKAPNDAENPDAEFIADQAHRTDKRTQARVTSTDQNDPEPNPGVEHSGASQDPGSADVTDIAQSDPAPGNPDRAFAKSAEDGRDKANENPTRQEQVPDDPSNRVFGEAAARAKGIEAGQEHSEAASKARVAREARAAADPFEKTLNNPAGADALPPESDRVHAQRAQTKSRHRAAPRGHGGRLPNLKGMGTLGLTPGGLNPNLNSLSALEAIGQNRLSQERVADGERRRSKHRGSWRPMGIERWRSAIENYVATVQPGNQTELNTARVPFANYLNEIHQRLHDEFAFKFLPSLDAQPNDSLLSNPELNTHIEIVLSRDDGRIVRMGVTRASGSTVFDVGALESVQRASPYGTPPREIVSPDGNVYLHWEFWRDPNYACSTYFAHPYILRFKPTTAPMPDPRPTIPVAPAEQEKHGQQDRRQPAPNPSPSEQGG